MFFWHIMHDWFHLFWKGATQQQQQPQGYYVLMIFINRIQELQRARSLRQHPAGHVTQRERRVAAIQIATAGCWLLIFHPCIFIFNWMLPDHEHTCARPRVRAFVFCAFWSFASLNKGPVWHCLPRSCVRLSQVASAKHLGAPWTWGTCRGEDPTSSQIGSWTLTYMCTRSVITPANSPDHQTLCAGHLQKSTLGN